MTQQLRTSMDHVDRALSRLVQVAPLNIQLLRNCPDVVAVECHARSLQQRAHNLQLDAGVLQQAESREEVWVLTGGWVGGGGVAILCRVSCTRSARYALHGRSGCCKCEPVQMSPCHGSPMALPGASMHAGSNYRSLTDTGARWNASRMPACRLLLATFATLLACS